MPDIIENDCIFLLLKDRPTDEELAFIESLHEIIKKCGGGVRFVDSTKMKSLPRSESLLCLSIDPKTARNSRHAGRRKVYPMGLIKVGDVKKMMENKSADAVAAELGISRATLFRRIKGKEDNRYL